jgi:predicted nucleic acid-binding protein
MTVEFIDTNILVYAHDSSAGRKHATATDLVNSLSTSDMAAVSIQVLAEFYAIATGKLRMPSEDAERMIDDYGIWTIHRPSHADLLISSRLRRRYRIAWWDALLLNSATQLGCRILWSEDFAHGQKYGALTVKNPFR